MNAITRFESFLESMVERSFARLFRARLQPVEIAKRLTREMEAGRVVGVSSVLVPNDYDVSLSREDFAAFSPIRASLEQDMTQYLARYAREHGYAMTAQPAVRLTADAGLRQGRVVAVGHLTEPSPGVLATERLEPTRTMPQVDGGGAMSPADAGTPGEAYLTLGETTYPLSGDSIALGRGLENTIVLEDRRVSRSHARLVCSQGHWSVRDEGSTNGTFVNGRMVTQHGLSNGDRLSLGGLELEFRQHWVSS